MDEFFFDLQRFVDYEITAGDSVTISANGTKTFSVTTGSGASAQTANYSLNVNGSVVVSTDTDGTVKFTVNSGFIRDFNNADNNSKLTAILLKGTYRNYYSSYPVTLGENGPTIEGVWTGSSFNYASITLTPGTDSDSVIITPSVNTVALWDLTWGGFSYTPTAGASFSATINKASGRTYIDVSGSNSSDTIRYNDGTTTHTYTPVSGTVTLAIDADGSNFTFTGLDQNDAFQIDGIAYTLGKVRFTSSETVDETTVTKFWNKGGVKSEVSASDIMDAGSFSVGRFISDGKIEISRDGTLLSTLGTDDSIMICAQLDSNDTDYSISYGSLHRGEGVGCFTLNGLKEETVYENDEETIRYKNLKYVSVEVEEGFTVTFNDAIGGVPISISGAPSISSTNMTAVVTATANDGTIVRKTVDNINPLATDEQIASLGSAINSFTDNTYVKTEKVVRINCDA